MNRIAIIAALPGELKALVAHGWKREHAAEPTVSMWSRLVDGRQLIAVCAGMGSAAATRAFAAAAGAGKLDAVLSIGWAGGLTAEALTGHLLIPSVVVDAQTGERFVLGGEQRKCTLVTTAHVANGMEKQRLAQTYGACMVDMEAATILRLAEGNGVPACCLKAITDDANASLPDLQRFIDANGQMQMLKFIAHVSVRPRYWSALAGLGKASSAASRTLARAIYNLVGGDTIDFKDVNRTGILPE